MINSSFSDLVEQLNPEDIVEENNISNREIFPTAEEFAADILDRTKAVELAIQFVNNDVITEYTTDSMLLVAKRIYKYIREGV